MHKLHAHKGTAPQTLQTTQAAPNPDLPLSVSMDFIEQLPASDGFTVILVVVDRLTKQSLFIPTFNTIDTPQVA